MRTLILLPDWDAVLFWREEGCRDQADERELSLPAALAQELRDYYAAFSELYFGGDPGAEVSVLDRRRLDDRGLALWENLREAWAGRYRVLFHSHEFGEAYAEPAAFRAERATAAGPAFQP